MRIDLMRTGDNSEVFKNFPLLNDIVQRNIVAANQNITSSQSIKVRSIITDLLRNSVHQFNKPLKDQVSPEYMNSFKELVNEIH